ncbi:MAG: 4'-phosphopantetheinyl transferase superfamily protein, partial [Xanthomonadales bacterium]|nr:4'-phosphopantetheinyl transferase superfamily protein [Xanthomonadales bacterium]
GKDVSLERGPKGKPVLDESRHGDQLHFSLAKSGRRILIGISGSGEVGVDLELEARKPRNAKDLSTRFFTCTEATAICELENGARDSAFMRVWACKEAVAKASGHGIANRFCHFSVEAPASRPPAVVEDQDLALEGWQLALLIPENGYIAAVAVRQPALAVEAFRL